MTTNPDGDRCQPVEIDGELIRVRGNGEMSDETRAALADVIGAAKRKYLAEHPQVEPADPERRERYAEALYNTLENSPSRHPWATLSGLRRAVWYDRADAAMALADAELAAVVVPPPAPRADDQAALRDRIAERPERYAVAIHDAMESDLSLVDQEPGQQALFARAAEAVMALADSEQATLRRKLAAAEKIRENADFHLGQEMARRQLAEKEAARLSADQAAVLNAAAQHLYTALFPAVYDDMGQKAAEGVQRAVSELRRLAVEAQQQPDVPDQTAMLPAVGIFATLVRQRADHIEAAHARMRDRLEVTRVRVQRLHEADVNGECAHCHDSYPCPTINALDLDAGPQQQPDSGPRRAGSEEQPETPEARPECAHCWREIENRSTPNMGGPPHDNWVHLPGGFTVCFPQRGADSPRAEPRADEAPQ